YPKHCLSHRAMLECVCQKLEKPMCVSFLREVGVSRQGAMHTTSASLLERLRRPTDQAAWARFVQLYTPLLYYWARHLGLQPNDAADLVQDVLTTLVQKLPEFVYDQHRSFRSWLRTLTLNRWHNNRRQRTVPVLDASAVDVADQAGADPADAFA